MKEILYFTAPWCKSCANLKAHIERIKQAGMTVHEIDVEKDPETAYEHDVMQLPTVILIQENSVISRSAGFSERMVSELYNFSKA